MTASIYLDNNSTTSILPEVVEAMTSCWQACYKNPASQHGSGRAARRVIERARENIGVILGASMDAPHQDQVIFTSGGTESNNLAIRGLVREPGHVLISGIEHPSSLEAADTLKSLGCEIEAIPVDSSGHVSLEAVRKMTTDETRLVCVMMGNNETGALQPVEAIAEVCLEHGVPMHCDAVQTVGKQPVCFRQLGVTTLAFSAHKFHGPLGVGGLILRGKTNLSPLIVGGSQQLGMRPGTESVASVVGMARALELSQIESESRISLVESLRNDLQNRLSAGCECVVNGEEPRLPHTLNISFPGVDRQALVMALDLAGVECSTGSACTSGSSEPSHVLVAMGLDGGLIDSSIRFSLSALNTESEVAEGSDRILAVINKLRRRK